jgi:hypothetical protein
MEAPGNEKLDGSIRNLAASALNQIRVLYLGWNIFGPIEFLHSNPNSELTNEY